MITFAIIMAVVTIWVVLPLFSSPEYRPEQSAPVVGVNEVGGGLTATRLSVASDERFPR